MTKENKRQRGRPPLEPGQAKRGAFNTRLRDAVKERLENKARAAGRSLSEEIEHRLERSLAVEDDARDALDMAYGRRLAGLLMLVGRVMGQVGTVRRLLSTEHADRAPRTGWLSDPWAFDEAVIAAGAIFEAYRPPGDPAQLATGETAQGWRGSGARSAEMVLASLRRDHGVEAELEYVYDRIGPPIRRSGRGR